MMNHHNLHHAPEETSAPVMAYPPPGYGVPPPPPPVGYPTMEVSASSAKVETKSKGDGFWKGCVAAICCCWVLEVCC